MIQLTQTEEVIMRFLWKRKKAFLKDLLNDFPDPKPAKTTLATFLKRLTEKGVIAYYENSNKREYYPLIKKKDYSSNSIKKLIQNFFDNSAAELASFCTTETNLSKSELEDLRKIIDEQIKKSNS